MKHQNTPLDRAKHFAHLPAVLIFLWLPVYGFVVVCKCELQLVDDITYLFHCVDYNLGFCNKFLPGTIYNLFVNTPSVFSATVYEYVLLLLFYAGTAVLLDKWYHRLPKQQKNTGLHLLFLYLTGSFTFASIIYEPGMLDESWLYLSILFILLMQNRYAKCALPLMGVVAVAVHYGCMITYIPFWALLLLYEYITAKTKDEKKKWGVIFILFCIFAIATFSYFIIFDKTNVKYGMDTFNKIIESRGSDLHYYFDYSLFFSVDNFEEFLRLCGREYSNYEQYKQLLLPTFNSPVLNFFGAIINQILVHFYLYSEKDLIRVFMELIVSLLILFPLLGMFFGFCKQKIEENKKTKMTVFFWLCVIIMVPFAVCASVFVSTDSVRWLNHAFLGLFTLMMYIIYKEGEAPLIYFQKYICRFSPVVVTVWQLIYTFSIFDPYV